jgi:hypothetical protein
MNQAALEEIIEKGESALTPEMLASNPFLGDVLESMKRLSGVFHDPDVYEEQTEAYVSFLPEILDDLKNSVRADLSFLQKSADISSRRLSTLERPMHFFPKYFVKFLFGLARLICFPKNLMRGTSFKSSLVDDIRKAEAGFVLYSGLKKSAEQALVFYENKLSNSELPEDVREKVEQCADINRDLAYLYSNSAAASRNNLKTNQRIYDLFYKKS